METVTGTLRAGRVEFDTPLPGGWSDGDAVAVTHEPVCRPVDICDSSPEAIAAWDAHFSELDAKTQGSQFPDELAAWLEREKSTELARWNETCRRLDAVQP